jgi:hypothetical protein
MIDENLLHLARDLRTHNDAHDRLDCAGSDHFGDSLTAANLSDLISGRQITLQHRGEGNHKQEYAKGSQH